MRSAAKVFGVIIPLLPYLPQHLEAVAVSCSLRQDETSLLQVKATVKLDRTRSERNSAGDIVEQPVQHVGPYGIGSTNAAFGVPSVMSQGAPGSMYIPGAVPQYPAMGPVAVPTALGSSSVQSSPQIVFVPTGLAPHPVQVATPRASETQTPLQAIEGNFASPQALHNTIASRIAMQSGRAKTWRPGQRRGRKSMALHRRGLKRREFDWRDTGRKLKDDSNAEDYVMTAVGQYCPSGMDIKTEAMCEDAAHAFGKAWNPQNAWYGLGDHRYCLLVHDGVGKVFFNYAGDEASSPTPPRQNSASLCLKTCTKVLSVTGAESVEPTSMGAFTKTSITPSSNHSGRAIYKNAHGRHLYFWKPAGNWIIETDGYFNNSVGVAYSHSDVECPDTATDWRVWVKQDNNSKWSSKFPIFVSQAVTSQTFKGARRTQHGHDLNSLHDEDASSRPGIAVHDGEYADLFYDHLEPH